MADAPAAATTAIQVDWRLWFVAAISAAGFCLSIYNVFRSGRIAKEARNNRDQIQSLDALHKERVIRLEEFRTSVRDPVRSTLPPLLSLGKRFAALSKTHISLDQQHDDLLKLNSEATAVLGAVYDALADANLSQFADGADWTDGVDEAQDKIAAELNIALDTAKPQIERLSAISTVSGMMLSLRDEVNSRLDSALRSFAEESNATPAHLN